MRNIGFYNPFASQIQQVRTFNRPARLFLIATILNGIIFSAWGLFFNYYILEQGLSREFLGLVTAAGSMAALVLGIPLGVLSDRLGRKRAMLIGAGLAIVSMGVEVSVRQPWLILAAAFVAGAGNTLYYLNHAPFMMKVSSPQNRTLLFSLNFGLVTLAGSVGALFAGQLPAAFARLLQVAPRSPEAYQAVLLMAVALSALTLIPLALIRMPSAAANSQAEGTAHPPPVLDSLFKILTRRTTFQLVLPMLLTGLGAAILIPYMNVFLYDRFAISDQLLGGLFALSSLMVGLGSIVGPRLADSLGSKIRAIVVTQALSLAFLLVVGFVPILWAASIGFLMRGTLMNMASPLYDAFAMEITPEAEQATINSGRNLGWQVGWAFGPYISGLVQAAYGFAPLFAATAVLYALAIWLTWRYFDKHEAALKPEAVPAD
jgi:MFS family permease